MRDENESYAVRLKLTDCLLDRGYGRSAITVEATECGKIDAELLEKIKTDYHFRLQPALEHERQVLIERELLTE